MELSKSKYIQYPNKNRLAMVLKTFFINYEHSLDRNNGQNAKMWITATPKCRRSVVSQQTAAPSTAYNRLGHAETIRPSKICAADRKRSSRAPNSSARPCCPFPERGAGGNDKSDDITTNFETTGRRCWALLFACPQAGRLVWSALSREAHSSWGCPDCSGRSREWRSPSRLDVREC